MTVQAGLDGCLLEILYLGLEFADAAVERVEARNNLVADDLEDVSGGYLRFKDDRLGGFRHGGSDVMVKSTLQLDKEA